MAPIYQELSQISVLNDANTIVWILVDQIQKITAKLGLEFPVAFYENIVGRLGPKHINTPFTTNASSTTERRAARILPIRSANTRDPIFDFSQTDHTVSPNCTAEPQNSYKAICATGSQSSDSSHSSNFGSDGSSLSKVTDGYFKIASVTWSLNADIHKNAITEKMHNILYRLTKGGHSISNTNAPAVLSDFQLHQANQCINFVATRLLGEPGEAHCLHLILQSVSASGGMFGASTTLVTLAEKLARQQECPNSLRTFTRTLAEAEKIKWQITKKIYSQFHEMWTDYCLLEQWFKLSSICAGINVERILLDDFLSTQQYKRTGHSNTLISRCVDFVIDRLGLRKDSFHRALDHIKLLYQLIKVFDIGVIAVVSRDALTKYVVLLSFALNASMTYAFQAGDLDSKPHPNLLLHRYTGDPRITASIPLAAVPRGQSTSRRSAHHLTSAFHQK